MAWPAWHHGGGACGQQRRKFIHQESVTVSIAVLTRVRADLVAAPAAAAAAGRAVCCCHTVVGGAQPGGQCSYNPCEDVVPGPCDANNQCVKSPKDGVSCPTADGQPDGGTCQGNTCVPSKSLPWSSRALVTSCFDTTTS
jgi:hypothetical protein